jgi:Kef-type K+ transport system membrane component KefB
MDNRGVHLVLEEILVLMAITYIISLFFGFLMQKYLRMPWIFASLFFGLAIAPFGFFKFTIESNLFNMLATFGMYTLLFMIGFNFELKKMEKLRTHIIVGTTVIMAMEGFFGSLLLYLVFPTEVSYSYVIALITALSFATVGEAVLLPILAEFKIIKTTFGQLTLGIGTLDDILEVALLVLVAILPGFSAISQTANLSDPSLVILDMVFLLLLTLVMVKASAKLKTGLSNHHVAPYISSLLTVIVFFSFVAIGGFVFEGLASVGAILAGMVVRSLLPKERLYENERAIEFLGYIFLSPLFFLSIGASVSLSALAIYPTLIILIWFVSKGSKLLGSYILFRKLLSNKYSLLLGLGLSIRFSTSLIVQYNLVNGGFISVALYSALVTTAIFMKPVVIGIYSWALSRGKPP